MRKVGDSRIPAQNPSGSAAPAATDAASTVTSSAAAAAAAAASPAAPAPTPEEKARAKGARQLSRQMSAESVRAGLQGKLPKGDSGESLAGKVSREAGNVGIIAGQVAQSTASTLGAVGGSLLDRIKYGNSVHVNIKDSYGKETLKDFKQAEAETSKELGELESKYNGKTYIPPDDNERMKRLRSLQDAFKNEPIVIARSIHENRSDPAYKVMGPTHFVSMEVETRTKLQGKHDYGLSTMQRVAIYGYTTKDFKTLNPALREARGGSPADPNLKAYADHITAGLAKLPDYDSKGAPVYRGMVSANLPAAVKSQLQVGGQLKDWAFASTSTDQVAAQSAGDTQLVITNPSGKGGKLLPFSAFEGEGEVLFPPGTQFDITRQVSNKRFEATIA